MYILSVATSGGVVVQVDLLTDHLLRVEVSPRIFTGSGLSLDGLGFLIQTSGDPARHLQGRDVAVESRRKFEFKKDTAHLLLFCCYFFDI